MGVERDVRVPSLKGEDVTRQVADRGGPGEHRSYGRAIRSVERDGVLDASAPGTTPQIDAHGPERCRHLTGETVMSEGSQNVPSLSRLATRSTSVSIFA